MSPWMPQASMDVIMTHFASKVKVSSIRSRLLCTIDDRDFDQRCLRLQLKAQLGRERVEHAGAGVFAGKSIDGATQPNVEGAGQARAIEDGAPGNAAEEVG